MLLSGSVRALLSVRIAAVLFALAGLLVLPGCWVQSINGLSEAEFLGTDKDQVYDPGLLGAWTNKSDDCQTTLEVTAEGKDYHWQMTGVGESCDKGKGDPAYYEAELFKLDDHRYLDLTASSNDVCQACIAVHWIFKIDVQKDSFSLVPIDSDWLKKAEKEKTVTLATAHGNYDTLTASPKELKEFVRRYADDGEVFPPRPDLTFQKKQP
jgi:hypothetical protein